MTNVYLNEYMCEVFMKHPDGGMDLPITGGGLLTGSKDEATKYGEDSVGKMVRHWVGKESEAECTGYKIWQRVY